MQVGFENAPALIMGSVVASQAIATAPVWALSRRNPQRDYSLLSYQLRSRGTVAALFALATISNYVIAVTLLGFVSFFLLRNYFSTIQTQRAERYPILIAYLSIPAHLILLGRDMNPMAVWFIPILLSIILFAMLWRQLPLREAARSLITIQWGTVSTIFFLSYLLLGSFIPTAIGFWIGGLIFIAYMLLLRELNKGWV